MGEETVGIVIPVYRPTPSRLRRFIDDLHETVSPDAVRIEWDAPAPNVDTTIDGATVSTVSRRRGKGAAITDGFDALDTDIVAFVDGDASIPAASVADIIDTLRARGGIVVGSRRHPESRVDSHQSRLRKTLGDVFAWLARHSALPPLSDYQCGVKAMHRETWDVLRDAPLHGGFAWDITAIGAAAAADIPVAEVPVDWHDRPESTVPTVRTAAALAGALIAANVRVLTAKQH